MARITENLVTSGSAGSAGSVPLLLVRLHLFALHLGPWPHFRSSGQLDVGDRGEVSTDLSVEVLDPFEGSLISRFCVRTYEAQKKERVHGSQIY